MYIFTGKGAIIQKPNDACNKTLCLALECTLQTGISFVALGCLDDQISVRMFTKFDRVCNQSISAVKNALSAYLFMFRL